ncbi:MAG TPA: hypothetical protein PK079_21715 [Leptospiraceae bacterium]|nr:hypothetical protein [Leptospiraceae bacterium]HMX35264.1 hypothetical protein [Leptospiraceae bacterium]HMY33978.1 hypothetical protein [Leptospiraceae bacterium]HMZ67652.1 hypothetical protein [Leptospiraceae bacterium]HNA09396.1 hypothetical protein [Leptospiraceae bacterium]
MLGITTSGILAVAVSGTFNTFTTGSLLKSADINANFASLKTAIEGIPTQKAMRLIYEYDVPSATTSVNVTGLDGDTDLTYDVRARFVSGTAVGGGYAYYIRPNNDSSSSYFSRFTYIDNAATPTKSYSGSIDNLGMNLCGSTMTITTSSVCFGNITIFAKSGYARMSAGKGFHHDAAANWFNYDYSTTYTNTGTNITSLTIYSPTSNAIGAGSRIEVWARR